MTKSELKRLVRNCLCEVHLNIDEGVILNAQDTADSIRDKFKRFYTSSSDEIAKQNPFDREYTKESIETFADWINKQFFYRLSKKDVLVTIVFKTLGSNTGGSYGVTKDGKSGIIFLNTFKYLVTKSGDKYKIIPPNEFDYDEFNATLEHELMHAEQHLRSGKQWSVLSGGGYGMTNDPEVKKMIANNPSEMSDGDYAKYVNYYNHKLELNTHAKEVANNYLKWWIEEYKQNNRSVTADQVKSLVTSVFTKPQQPNNKIFLDKLMSLFDGYGYLTPKNRNKWWNYVYKSILGMKYSGVNEPSPIPQNESIKCPNCGAVNAPEDMFCNQCGTKLNLKKENIMTKSELKQLIKEVISEMSVNENYEDNIKDTKDRMAYLALRKQEKDYISKSKQSSSAIKKQHYMDMSKQVLDKALDILKKHKVVDEANTNLKEVQGYVFGPMETPNNWISTNAKPKMKNGTKKWVVSAADFQKAFPNIQMKQLPTNPSKYSDYYIVDNEGDLISYSQTNIGSGLD